MNFNQSYQEQIESPLLTDIFDTADDNDNTIAANIRSGNNIDEKDANAKEVSDNSSVAREISISEARTHESRRVHTTLYRLAKALARLKLKQVVDAEDARETMQYYNVILQQHKQAVCIPDSPSIVVYNECLSILKENEVPLSLEILAKKACDSSQQAKHYLGTDLRLNKNWKLRKVSEMLVNHDSINVVQVKPTVLQYIEKSRIDNYTPAHKQWEI